MIWRSPSCALVISSSHRGGSDCIDSSGEGVRSGGCRGDGVDSFRKCRTSYSCGGDGISSPCEGGRSSSHGGDSDGVNRSSDRSNCGVSSVAISGSGEG